MGRLGLPVAVVVLALTSFFSTPISAQETTSAPTTQAAEQPRFPTFAEHYALVRKAPLLLPENTKSASGNPLSAAQKAEAENAEKLLQEARSARMAGEYEKAQKAALECVRIRMGLFGAGHYETIYAVSEEKTLRRYAQSPPEELMRLADADKAVAKADECLDRCEYASAVAHARRAVDTLETILGRGHHELGSCYRIIGSAQTELLSLDEAEATLAKAVDLTEKAYGKNHPVLARVLDRQGWMYINKGDNTKALTCAQTAVRIYGLTCGDTLDAAEAIDNLGTVLLIKGDPLEAATQKLRALVIREALGGPEHRDVGISYSNLAWLYARTYMPQEVVPMRQKALAIFEKALGPDHPYTSTETVNLGVALQDSNRADEAIKLYLRAVDRDAKRSEPVDAKVVGRMTHLGIAYFAAGKRDEADKTLQSAIDKAAEVRKLGNPKGAAGELKKVADTYEAYRMFDQAVKAIELAVQWDKEAGSPDESVVFRANQLATLLVNVGRAKEARDLSERMLSTANTLFGKGDRRTAGLMLAASMAYERCGELDKAERMCNDLIRISETKFGPESRSNAVALREMGRIYLLQKKPDLARFSLDEARKLTEKYKEFEPIEMIRVLFEYGDLQIASGQKAEGIKSFRDALEMARKASAGAGTPHVDAVIAKAIKKVIDAVGPDASDKDSLKSELRQILEKLDAARALDAENKAWLAELGGAAKG